MAHNIEHGQINVPNNIGSPYPNPTDLTTMFSKHSSMGPFGPTKECLENIVVKSVGLGYGDPILFGTLICPCSILCAIIFYFN
jgi:hypothetical protein